MSHLSQVNNVASFRMDIKVDRDCIAHCFVDLWKYKVRNMKTFVVFVIVVLTVCSGRRIPISPCPNGEIQTRCYLNPCRFSQCPNNPFATCRPNYCGGCNAEWFFGNTQVFTCGAF